MSLSLGLAVVSVGWYLRDESGRSFKFLSVRHFVWMTRRDIIGRRDRIVNRAWLKEMSCKIEVDGETESERF